MRVIFIILVLIPALVALGNDFYLFAELHLEKKPFSIALLQKEFQFSALGFIWTHYDLASFKETVKSMPPEDWARIDKMLTFKAFYVGLTFAGIMTTLFFILGLAGVGPFAKDEESSGSMSLGRQSKSARKESFRAGSKSKKANYKRK